MAGKSKVEWTKSGKIETSKVPVVVDGETVGHFDKVRPAQSKDANGKVTSETFATIDEAAKALGFKKPANAIRALFLGKNKMNATKARAQAKLDALD